jgi:hypothetical protein
MLINANSPNPSVAEILLGRISCFPKVAYRVPHFFHLGGYSGSDPPKAFSSKQ